MQKIYRRKNEQIPKDYVCTEGCGKAYGSYAALYTHMKNKHGLMRPSQIKSTNQVKIKATGKKGRPMVKSKQAISQGDDYINENVCKLCYEQDCICQSSIGSEDVEKNIAILSDQAYMRLISCISQLNVGEQFTWIRPSENDYHFLSKEELMQMVAQFNDRLSNTSELYLSQRWLEYLSHLSKYLDTRWANELYQGIFIILSKKSMLQIETVVAGKEEQLIHLNKCGQKSKQWKEFVETVLMI